MYYETAKNDHGLPFNPLKACVVPRPIGWISTISTSGVINLAPYSFFNLLSYDPPFVLFSGGASTKDKGIKDTVVNAQETGEFVYNLATWAQREQVTTTSQIEDRGVDELAAAGLSALPSRLVRPPRVAGAPVHFECRYFKTVELPGNRPASVHHVVFGEVVAVHIDDAYLTADGLVDVVKMRPLARLGYRNYSTVDWMFEMEKGMPEQAVDATLAFQGRDKVTAL
jgi:flavin reductase (DIM6/NTAB) family NADH-FMN oxidoreductase RutF